MQESRESKAVIAIVDDGPSEPTAYICSSARGPWLVPRDEHHERRVRRRGLCRRSLLAFCFLLLEEARENARRIVRDGKRAAEVIARIRALSNRAATARERLDLNETIQDVLAFVADEAKKESMIVRTQFAADLSPVSADRVQLQQVILNVVMNAIEAMSSVGDRARELVITTRNIDPDQVQVTVEDSGTGIDPQKIDKIFDSFYTTKPSGMGMGLSICRSILQAHGGRLWATAKDGLGMIFNFTLPTYHEEGSHARVPAV